MTERITALVQYWIGLCAITSLAEALLPGDGVFRSARVTIALAYLVEVCTALKAALSGIGG